MTKRYYNLPHLHAAVKCLRAGYPENAASWMNRDIGEMTSDPGEEADPNSLRLCPIGTIEYETVRESNQGLHGDGI